MKERDPLSKNALEWFVNEQREEVASADTHVRMVKRAGEPSLACWLRRTGAASESQPRWPRLPAPPNRRGV